MQIPLPETIRGSKVLPKQSEYLQNLLNIGGNRVISRPACALVTAAAGEQRGSFTYQGVLYVVYGNQLYSGTALVAVGAIAGAGPIHVAKGFNHAVIVTGSAGGNYTLTPAGVLTAIVSANLPACVDVDYLEGRFVYVPADGSPLIYSDVGDGSSVQPLSFFDAESLPDKNKAVSNIKNDLFVFGEESIERFRNTGTVTAPFQVVPNAMVEIGYVGGKIKTKDSVLFLGKDKDNGYAIYLFDTGTGQIISTDAINELLNRDYTPADLASVRTQRFNWRGNDCYVFALPNKALLLQNGRWSYIDSGINGMLALGAFPFYGATLFNGTWYLQGPNGLNQLTSDHADSTGQFARQIVTFARSSEEGIFTPGHLELKVAGNVGVGTMGLAVSKNGSLWSAPFYRDLPAQGDYDTKLRWHQAGGLGRYDGFIGVRIYTTSNVEIAADSMVMQ